MATNISDQLKPLIAKTQDRTAQGQNIMKDILGGTEVGEAILGPEGLGRAGADPEIKQILERAKEQSVLGLGSREFQLRREKALQGVGQATSTAQRQLQAKMARLGVRGGMAGKKAFDIEARGLQQRANVERDLFLESANVQRDAFKDFAKAQAGVTNFDLQQAAKEKAAILGAGTSFAQLGQAERAGQAAAAAQVEAARAQGRGGGGKK
jgi:hypothetical protein